MTGPTPTTRVLAFVPDLMDQSRITGTPGIDVRFVGSPSDLEGQSTAWPADVVVVDLARPGVLEVLQDGAITGRVIGFGSHVDTEVLDAARAAGCSEVFPRSRFFARVSEVLTR